jgi:hypothetical protein
MIRLLLMGLLFSVVLLISCSEDKTPLESVSHEEGWTNPSSEVFHAKKVTISGAVSCRSCHGEDVDSRKMDTFCQDCHEAHPNATYPHRYDWNIIGDPDNHANYLKTAAGESNCISCHGGSASALASSCSRCHASN